MITMQKSQNSNNKISPNDVVIPNKLLPPNISNISFNNVSCLHVESYYDKYEADCGDGFYPLWALSNFTSNKNEYSKYGNVNITFKLIIDEPGNNNKYIWKQCNDNEYNIDGLDGNSGDLLLQRLNDVLYICHPDKEKGFCIVNKNNKILFPKI